jgi:hypothetical protein
MDGGRFIYAVKRGFAAFKTLERTRGHKAVRDSDTVMNPGDVDEFTAEPCQGSGAIAIEGVDIGTLA